MRQFFYSDTLCWLISSRSSIASSGAIDGLFKKIIQNKEHSVICNTSYNNITVFTHLFRFHTIGTITPYYHPPLVH